MKNLENLYFKETGHCGEPRIDSRAGVGIRLFHPALGGTGPRLSPG